MAKKKSFTIDVDARSENVLRKKLFPPSPPRLPTAHRLTLAIPNGFYAYVIDVQICTMLSRKKILVFVAPCCFLFYIFNGCQGHFIATESWQSSSGDSHRPKILGYFSVCLWKCLWIHSYSHWHSFVYLGTQRRNYLGHPLPLHNYWLCRGYIREYIYIYLYSYVGSPAPDNMCKAHTKDKFRFRQVHLQILCWKRVKVTKAPEYPPVRPMYTRCQALFATLPRHIFVYLCVKAL